MAREKKKRDDGMEIPGWIVTYGDMMSLLLCFFVLLLSFSTISEKKYAQAIQSLKGALGVLPKNLTTIEVSPIPKPERPTRRAMEEMARRLRRELQVKGREKDIEIQFDEQGGLKINLPSRILFDTARAELKPDAAPILDDLAGLLAELPNANIEVRGHTDSRPLTSTGFYKDNYDLSYGRAKTVMLYLNTRGNIPKSQFEVIACGPSQPKATNDTPEGQQENRRVELYVRGDMGEESADKVRKALDAYGGESP